MATPKAYFRDMILRIERCYRSRFGYRIRLIDRFLLNRRSFGHQGIDLELLKIIKRRRVYFVELGANDGVTQSNTLLFELMRGWRGLLIEPIPSVFMDLKKNRNSNLNTLAQVACVGFDFSGKHVEIWEANQMSSPIVPRSDVLDPMQHAKIGHERQKKLGPNPTPKLLSVPAKTLTSVLLESKAPKSIDFLSVDCEGGEMDVLHGTDFQEFQFDWILVENRTPDLLKSFMSKKGYSFFAQLSHHDFLFIRRELNV